MIIQSKLPVKFEFEPWIDTESATPDMFGYGPDEQLLVICVTADGREVLALGHFFGEDCWDVAGMSQFFDFKVTCWKPAPTRPSKGGPVWQALK